MWCVARVSLTCTSYLFYNFSCGVWLRIVFFPFLSTTFRLPARQWTSFSKIRRQKEAAARHHSNPESCMTPLQMVRHHSNQNTCMTPSEMVKCNSNREFAWLHQNGKASLNRESCISAGISKALLQLGNLCDSIWNDKSSLWFGILLDSKGNGKVSLQSGILHDFIETLVLGT